MKVKAAVAEELGSPLEIRELALDEPRANEVQVRMTATGVCHTDAVVRDGWIPTTLPLVLGHEGAGVVERVGAAVTHLQPGDHVVLSVNSCGACRSCLAGHPAYCEDSYAHNFAGGRIDGSSAFSADDGSVVRSHFFGQSSFAEVVNASVRSVVKIPDDFPLELAGPLGCGIQTGAGAVLNVLRPAPGGSFVVFGAGAVGMSALLAAVAGRVGTIVAVDVNDGRLALARELGATHTINGSSEDAVARILEITGGGVQTALDTTGNAAVFRQMVAALGVAGHAAALGAASAGSEGVIDLPTALSRGIRITWVVEGDAVPQLFIPELIALHRAGQFPYDRLVKTYPFDDIATAFADSESGEVLKPVVVF
ncbi:NAD(P)-dependent alcohol dehydrogenase [Microbacterium marinilacus]|uniref:NAD(P)-dependent alcohol dehydrogenase n=1 Tax=Microbacterium marinilacus TaxID=415209 RepID=A0ABP7BT47_9MICO|nr:NAD(P)-dependent alcohol dehydrogenase [Microbacterium marinilacus]MBY0688279.1 NAD(P)-dependent alcohol dehydrogenase [Microbacterium marinilacus]